MKDVHYTFDVPKGKQRFRELVVYASERSVDDPHFGATKLNKILFYSDFRAFERFGEPLTGFAYFALPEGPAPYLMRPVRSELEREGAIWVEEKPVGNYSQTRTIARRGAFLDLFSLAEIALVDEVIEELRPKTAREVSLESHGVAWRTRLMEGYIPYEAIFYSDEEATPQDIAEARQLNERYKWGLRV
jgi:hypothetical protein